MPVKRENQIAEVGLMDQLIMGLYCTEAATQKKGKPLMNHPSP